MSLSDQSLAGELMTHDSKLLTKRLSNMDKGLLKPTGKLMSKAEWLEPRSLFVIIPHA